MPSGAGFSFFSPSTAFETMPFFGPSFAGRSNSTTGTLTLTRWAAICAPITPAPSTATLRTLNRFIDVPLEWVRPRLFRADPGLRAAQDRGADVAAHLELRAAVDRLQADAIDLAVVRIEDVAAVPDRLVAVVLLDPADQRHADDRLVLALVGALLADGVGRRRRVEQLLEPAGQHAAGFADAEQ